MIFTYYCSLLFPVLQKNKCFQVHKYRGRHHLSTIAQFRFLSRPLNHEISRISCTLLEHCFLLTNSIIYHHWPLNPTVCLSALYIVRLKKIEILFGNLIQDTGSKIFINETWFVLWFLLIGSEHRSGERCAYIFQTMYL